MSRPHSVTSMFPFCRVTSAKGFSTLRAQPKACPLLRSHLRARPPEKSLRSSLASPGIRTGEKLHDEKNYRIRAARSRTGTGELDRELRSPVCTSSRARTGDCRGDSRTSGIDGRRSTYPAEPASDFEFSQQDGPNRSEQHPLFV